MVSTESSPTEHMDHTSVRAPVTLEAGGVPPSLNILQLVSWDHADDPENPHNWSPKKKWIVTLVVSSFTFVAPVSSSMIAPASENVATEFDISSDTVIALITSIFVLAFALGPLFWGPLSEIYGRSTVLRWSNFFYFIWNLACGFSKNTTQIIVFRFFAGLGGSAPLSLGAAILGDIWSAEQRGSALAIYSMAPLIGPCLGPVAGAWIADKSDWRWVFWSTSILAMAVQASGVFFLRESYAPVLLERKAKRLQKESRRADLEKGKVDAPVIYKTIYSASEERHWISIYKTSLLRPWAMFAQEMVIQLVGLYMAILYGIYYLFLTIIPLVFSSERGVYHQSPGIAGLHYIALGIGPTGAAQLNSRKMDRIYLILKERYGEGKGRPEFRVPSMIPSAICMPLGLFLSGWAAQGGAHWIITDLGICFVGAGMILGFQSMQIYIVDVFTLYAASAMAAVSCLRSLFGFAFPLFARQMYARLGYGVGNSILAAASLAIGVASPMLFWRYGEAVRSRSRYS